MKFQLITSILIGAATVLAGDGYHYYPESELVVMACKYSLYHTATFCAKDSATSYKCVCGNNQPALGSLMYCVYDNYGEYNKEVNDIIIEYCGEIGKNMTATKLKKSYDNATQYIENTSDITNFNASKIIYEPVYYTKKSYTRSFNSYKVRWTNISDSMYMGAGLLGFWGLVLLIGIIHNVLVKVGFIQQYFHSAFINKIRKHLSFASLFPNKQHARPLQFLKIFGGFIPTRIQSIVLFSYFVLYSVFLGVRYHYVLNDTIWASEAGQRSRYIGDRSGILVLYTLQLTYLFAGRNNFMTWLTGWKLSTFLAYHKWISRLNFIIVVIHSGSMYVQSYSISKLQSRAATTWFRTGIAGAVCMGFIVFFASYAFRRMSYEVFLATHLVFGIAFMGTAWKHVENFEYQQFFYAMMAIWAFDRVVRILRLFYFGVQTATVSIKSDEILKIVVPKRSIWKTYPGAFGYVHFLQYKTFFQSHPFTIVENNKNEIVFYAKIKGGITSATANYLNQFPDKTAQIKVTVEGPYGNPLSLKRYDDVLYYSGGTGIATAYSHILELLQNKSEQRIKVYWTLKDLKSFDWFKDELLKLKGSAVKIIVYITRHDGSSLSLNEKISDSETQSEEDLTTQLLKEFDFVEFRIGRPNIPELVKNDISESKGHVAVLATAHNSLVDDVRDTTGSCLDLAHGRVDYFEDLQVW